MAASVSEPSEGAFEEAPSTSEPPIFASEDSSELIDTDSLKTVSISTISDDDASVLSADGGPRRSKLLQPLSLSDLPDIAEACERYLSNKDTERLAAIAREVGLPPYLRLRGWMMLLETHPYVLKPRFEGETLTKDTQKTLKTLSEHCDRSVLEESIQRDMRLLKAKLKRAGICGTGVEPVKEACADIVNAVSLFINKWHVPYDSSMLWVAYTVHEATGAGQFTGLPVLLERVMLVVLHETEDRGSDRMAIFIGAFRTLMPELCCHFDEENVLSSLGGDEWLVWWIRWFGVRAFSCNDLARMWDAYFGWRPVVTDQPEPGQHHIYCCLAVFKALQYKLLELDQSEIRQLLSRVPARGGGSLIKEAGALREASVNRAKHIDPTILQQQKLKNQVDILV